MLVFFCTQHTKMPHFSVQKLKLQLAHSLSLYYLRERQNAFAGTGLERHLPATEGENPL